MAILKKEFKHSSFKDSRKDETDLEAVFTAQGLISEKVGEMLGFLFIHASNDDESFYLKIHSKFKIKLDPNKSYETFEFIDCRNCVRMMSMDVLKELKTLLNNDTYYTLIKGQLDVDAIALEMLELLDDAGDPFDYWDLIQE